MILNESNDAPISRPADLGPAGVELWDGVWESQARGWINDSDIQILVLACRQADVVKVAQNRAMVTTDPGDIRCASAAMVDLAKLLSLLGLSPSDRARLNIQTVQAVSTLERLRKSNGSQSG